MSPIERELPLFPLEQLVLFPGMPLPLRIFEDRYKIMIGSCQVTDQIFGVLLIRSGREVGEAALPERVGCTARMLRIDRLPDGQMHLLTVGERRFRLVGPARTMPEGYLVGDVRITDDEPPAAVNAALVDNVVSEFEKYQAAIAAAGGGRELKTPPEVSREPVRLSFWVGAMLQVHPRERQQLLELDDVGARLERELTLLRRENRPPATIGPFSPN